MGPSFMLVLWIDIVFVEKWTGVPQNSVYARTEREMKIGMCANVDVRTLM